MEKIRENLKQNKKRILISAPTGFGKTILGFEICKNAINKGNRVLFTSHRIQLAKQTFDKFKSLKPSYLQGNSDGYNEDSLLLIGTIQTLINRQISEPKIIIIDEVHYAYESKLIKDLFDKFPNAIFIGLSATPLDNRGFLLDGFDAIIDDFQTEDLIKMGYLVPFKIYSPIQIDLNNIPIIKNDYDNLELEKTINKETIINSIVENYLKHGENRKFICFSLNKIHAKEIDIAFNNSNILTKIIDADTPENIRNNYLNDFKIGKIKGLINIDILTTGFDEPTCGCIILAVPTKSYTKYIQCCGRGIRLDGNNITESILNGKKDCILIDCANAVLDNGLPHTRRSFIFGKKISRVIDKEFGFDLKIDNRNSFEDLPIDKKVFLKKIGSLLDLYEGKDYLKESDLQDDVNNFLDKTDFFYWRQNSGKMFKDGRWIHFASKSGLPDNTVFYKNSSLFFGIELKLKNGRLSDHQKKTLPEMIQRGVLFFIAECVYDVYKIIEFIEMNIIDNENEFIVKKSIYDLFEREILLRKKLNLHK